MAGKTDHQTQATLSFPDEGRQVLSPSKRFPIALMDGPESRWAYERLGIWRVLNDAHGRTWRHPITGENYTIDLYATGDWKFLHTMLGLSKPNQDFFCLFCKCTKGQIANDQLEWTRSRTCEEQIALCGSSPVDHDCPAQRTGPSPVTEATTRDQERYSPFTPKDLYEEAKIRLQYSHLGGHYPFRSNGARAWLLNDDRTRPISEQIKSLQRLQSTLTDAKRSTRGYVEPSLMPRLPYENVVIDVLHCFLRVYDVLFRLLVEDAAYFGRACLDSLESAVREAASLTTFRITTVADDRSISGTEQAGDLTWKCLDGDHKRQVVENIDIKAIFASHVPTGRKFDSASRQLLWTKLADIYTHMREWDQTIGQTEFTQLCRSFLSDMLRGDGTRPAAGGTDPVMKRLGMYFDADVTPYIHALAYHVPELMAQHRNLMQFSCYASEKANHCRSRQNSRQTAQGGGMARAGCTQTPDERHMEQLMRAALRAVVNPVHSPARNMVCEEQGCYKTYVGSGALRQHYGLEHPNTERGREWRINHPNSRRLHRRQARKRGAGGRPPAVSSPPVHVDVALVALSLAAAGQPLLPVTPPVVYQGPAPKRTPQKRKRK